MTGSQAGAADDRGHDQIRLARRGFDQRVRAGCCAAIGSGRARLQLGKRGLVRDRPQAWRWSAARPRPARRHWSPRSARRPRSVPATARPGRASSCRSSRWRRGWRSSLHARPASCAASGQDRHRDEAVEPVEEAAMARGASRRESLTPARRFILLSNKSPAWAATANSGASSKQRRSRPVAKTQAPPNSAAAAMPPYSPSTVLPGLIEGASLRLPNRAPGEIGADVRRPGDEEDPQQQRQPVVAARSRIHSKRQRRHQRVDEAADVPADAPARGRCASIRRTSPSRPRRRARRNNSRPAPPPAARGRSCAAPVTVRMASSLTGRRTAAARAANSLKASRESLLRRNPATASA